MGALKQAFYGSQEFRDIRLQTMDIRIHPVLGGISSTLWAAYDTFARRQSKLVDTLKDRPALAPAIQLVSQQAVVEQPMPPSSTGIAALIASNGRLQSSGLLAGDRRANRLTGTSGADVLMGLQGDDRLRGEGGGDILCGGGGRDHFLFSREARSQPGQMDQITDFRGDRGDRLRIEGATRLIDGGDFTGTPGDVTTIVWMADVSGNHPGHLPLWRIQGMHLALDRDGDRRADLRIDLPGVAHLDPSWLILH